MKKRYILEKLMLSLSLVFLLTACEYDDSDLTGRVDGLEERIENLEKLCAGINADIEALQKLVDALQNRDYVTSVDPMTENGEVVGYWIRFKNSEAVLVRHGADGRDGEDGADGQDGRVPQIGVQLDSDGHYYWTVDGKWLLDENGEKVLAEGIDGQDGSAGSDGQDGQDGQDGADGENGADGRPGNDGKDGVTPQLKIGEDGFWYCSMDGGRTWSLLYDGIPDQGAAGNDGTALFDGVEVIGNEVHIRLSSGEVLVLPMVPVDEYEPVRSLNVMLPEGHLFCTRSFDPDVDESLSLQILVSPKSALKGLRKNYKEVFTLRGEQLIPGDQPLSPCVMPAVDAEFDDEQGIMTVHFDTDAIPDVYFDLSAYFIDDFSVIKLRACYDDGQHQVSSGEFMTVPLWYCSGFAYFGGELMNGRMSEIMKGQIRHEAYYPDLGMGVVCFDPETKAFPVGIQDDNVTEICLFPKLNYLSEGAFKGFRNLKSVSCTLENPVILEAGAFEDCKNLESVDINIEADYFPDRTFKNCSALEAVYISTDGLREIGKECFSGCSVLSFYYNDFQYLTVIGDSAFSGTAMDVMDVHAEKIGKRAFYGCSNLYRIKLNSAVQSIGDEAFGECPVLEYVDVYPVTPPVLGSNVFPSDGFFNIFFYGSADRSVYEKDPGWSVYKNVFN